MSTTKTISRNVALLGASGAASMLIAAATDLMIARHLGAGPFGQYATAVAFASIFVVFTDFGMTLTMVRAGSRDRDSLNRYFGNSLAVKLATALPLYALMALSAHLLGYPATTRHLIMVIGIATLLVNIFPTFSAVFEVFQRMGKPAVFRTLTFALVGLLSGVGVLTEQGVLYFGYVNLLATVVVGVIWWRVAVNRVKPELEPSQLVPMIKDSLPFGVGGVFWIGYFRVGTVLLSLMRSDWEVGVFSAAFKLFEIVTKMALTVSTAVLPTMYRHAVSDVEKLRTFYRSLSLLFAVLAFPAAVGVFALASWFVPLLYGERFTEAVVILQVLAWAMLLRLLSNSPGDVLTATDRVNWKTAVLGVGTALNIALNVVLIGQHGYLGAAVATVISELAMFGLLYFLGLKALSATGQTNLSNKKVG